MYINELWNCSNESEWEEFLSRYWCLKQVNCVFLEKVYRNKANELNHIFGTTEWTPRKIDKALYTYGIMKQECK